MSLQLSINENNVEGIAIAKEEVIDFEGTYKGQKMRTSIDPPYGLALSLTHHRTLEGYIANTIEDEMEGE